MADNVLEIIIKATAAQAIGELARVGQEMKGVSQKAGDTQTAMQRLVNATTGVTQASNSARDSARAWMTGIDAEKAAFDRLRASFDPMFAAQLRYKTNLQEITLQQKLGTISQQEATQAINANAAALQRATGGADPLAAGLGRVGQSAAQVRGQLQNAAYQVGDFAVQVAGGTSATRAFAQQLPQLLGGFGLWGAVFGAATAIMVPFIGKLFETGQSADDAKDRLKDFSSALDAYVDYAKIAGSSTDDLEKKFGRFADQMQKNADRMAKIKLGQAQQALGDDAAGLQQQLRGFLANYKAMSDYLAEHPMSAGTFGAGTMTDELQRYKDEFGLLRVAVDDAAAAMGLSVDQALRLNNVLGDVSAAQGPQAIADASQKALDALDKMFPAGRALPPVIADIMLSLNGVHDSAVNAALASDDLAPPIVKFKAVVDEAFSAMVAMVNAQPDDGWLSTAISRAGTLADKLWDAAKGAAAAQGTAPLTGPAGMGAGTPVTVRDRKLQADQEAADAYSKWTPPSPSSSSGSGGGGGGGSVTDLADLQKKAEDAMNAMNLAISAINAKVQLGLMSTSEAEKAVDSARMTAGNAMAELIPQMEKFGTTGSTAADKVRGQIKAVAGEMKSLSQEITKAFTDGFEKSFASFLAGTKSASDAFKDFGQSVLDTMAKIVSQRFTDSVIAPLVDSIFSVIGLKDGGVVPHAKGGAVEAFAKGGLPGIGAHANTVVDRPTFFAMGGDRTGLMGEAGKEAIMPMRNGGVRATGPGGDFTLPLARDGSGALAVVTPFAAGGIPGKRDFTYPAPRAAAPYVFVPPGAGVTPAMAMARSMASDNGRQPATAPGNVIVNITPEEGKTYRETGRRSQGNDTILDIVRETATRAVASDITNGGPVTAALMQSFNVKRNLS